jgi:hypothetical protein
MTALPISKAFPEKPSGQGKKNIEKTWNKTDCDMKTMMLTISEDNVVAPKREDEKLRDHDYPFAERVRIKRS